MDKEREQIVKIEKFFSAYRRIAIYQFFADLADSTRMIYLAWFYLTLAVIFSIPFIPIEILIMMPLSKYNQRLREKARAKHLEKVKKERNK